MGKIPYKQKYNGDSVIVYWKKESHKIACCDCGLVHRLEFDVKKDGELLITFFHEKRATAQCRRSKTANYPYVKKATNPCVECLSLGTDECLTCKTKKEKKK